MNDTEHVLRLEPARRLAGELRVPGDKSVSHRYLMLGAIARGTTRVSGLATGADVASTRACLASLGVLFEGEGPEVSVGAGGWARLRAASGELDAGNSGTTLRLLAGLLAGRPFDTRVTGDASLRRRPMRRVIAPLEAMGGRIESTDGRAPVTIRGRALRAVTWRQEVPSAQVKSAVMFAALSATGDTTIEEPIPTRDHSERAFPLFGLEVRTTAPGRVTVSGGQEATAPEGVLAVPGDPSSAAVWAAGAAALPGSDVTIDGVLLNPRRLGFLRALEQLGARIDVEETGRAGGEPVGRIRVRHQGNGSHTIAGVDVPDAIDELPVLAARAALGGELRVEGASELRVKESDRISTLVAGLRALGVAAEELPDGFVVRGGVRPSGGVADAAGDHRMVMAFALVGLGASGATIVRGADAVAVSYPGFEGDLARLSR